MYLKNQIEILDEASNIWKKKNELDVCDCIMKVTEEWVFELEGMSIEVI